MALRPKARSASAASLPFVQDAAKGSSPPSVGAPGVMLRRARRAALGWKRPSAAPSTKVSSGPEATMSSTTGGVLVAAPPHDRFVRTADLDQSRGIGRDARTAGIARRGAGHLRRLPERFANPAVRSPCSATAGPMTAVRIIRLSFHRRLCDRNRWSAAATSITRFWRVAFGHLRLHLKTECARAGQR